MKNQEYADTIAKNVKAIDVLYRYERRLRKEWVERNCPIKIGDIVEVNDYSFEGKKIKVDRVDVTEHMTHGCNFDITWKWLAFGPVINKAGTTGKNKSLRSIPVEDLRMEKSIWT